MPDQIPKAVTQERYERLVALVNEVSWEENKALQGRDVEVMFALGEGRKDFETNRLSGRARDNRLVHATVSDDPSLRPRPGDIATVTITHAAPHHLTSDVPITGLRRTRGGDAWQAATEQPLRPAVGLGLPGFGQPATPPPAGGC